ncbi:MAG: hypothetical protein LBO82_02635, partial [Synergistaceae bacterium]|nr:hypothetical protein [Synergistaceae bacterium]
MSKFGMLSGKSARKVGLGLLVLSLLLLAAAPRAWGKFMITDTSGAEIDPDEMYGKTYSEENGVLTILDSVALLNAVISGDGKGIVLESSSRINLTLKNLTVSADEGPALHLRVTPSAHISIAGTVTLNSKNGDGFSVSGLSSSVIVTLDAVSEDSILRTSASGDIGENFCGLTVGDLNANGSELLLLGDGKFEFTGSGGGNGIYSDAPLYVGGSAALSAEGGLSGSGRADAIAVNNNKYLILFENAKIESAKGGIDAGGSLLIMDNASVSSKDMSIEYAGKTETLSPVRIKVKPSGSYLVGKSPSYVTTNPAGWGENWFLDSDISLLSDFRSDNGLTARVTGVANSKELPIGSVDLTFDGDGPYFLVSLDIEEEDKEKVLSIRYKTGSESESEEPPSYPFSGNSVEIQAMTRNIPAGTYTVELHGSSGNVSLGGVRISSDIADAPSGAVTYDAPAPESRDVTYENNVHTKDATLTFTLTIPDGVPPGTSYEGLSFSMKKAGSTSYNAFFLFQLPTRYTGAQIVPSPLWLPAFTLVKESPYTPAPPLPPEPVIIIIPPDDLPVPPEAPAGIAGVSVATEDGESREAQKQPDGTYLVVLPAGSDLGSVTVRIELPDGKILDLSDWDFSKGPREI